MRLSCLIVPSRASSQVGRGNTHQHGAALFKHRICIKEVKIAAGETDFRVGSGDEWVFFLSSVLIILNCVIWKSAPLLRSPSSVNNSMRPSGGANLPLLNTLLNKRSYFMMCTIRSSDFSLLQSNFWGQMMLPRVQCWIITPDVQRLCINQLWLCKSRNAVSALRKNNPKTYNRTRTVSCIGASGFKSYTSWVLLNFTRVPQAQVSLRGAGAIGETNST